MPELTVARFAVSLVETINDKFDTELPGTERLDQWCTRAALKYLQATSAWKLEDFRLRAEQDPSILEVGSEGRKSLQWLADQEF